MPQTLPFALRLEKEQSRAQQHGSLQSRERQLAFRQQLHPPSPTLTNPDMILPEHERARSPGFDLHDRDQTVNMLWTNVNAAVPRSDCSNLFIVATSGSQSPYQSYGPTGPMTPTTPIMYGNGTMLSDIGEVTEVENTPGRTSPSQFSSMARGSESTAQHMQALKKIKSKQSLKSPGDRRKSIESTSTITAQDQAAHFADFDDSVSMGGSVFQGDDEESLASSYVEDDGSAREPGRLHVSRSVDRLSTYSTVSTYSATTLSRRAEQILANAKKRLTTMEGNLSQARGSLHATSSLSILSPGSDTSTPPPPSQRPATAVSTRSSSCNSSPNDSPGHSRISSSIALRNGLSYRISTQRSASALGTAGGQQHLLTSSKTTDQMCAYLKGERGSVIYNPATARDTILESPGKDTAAPMSHLGLAHRSKSTLTSPINGWHSSEQINASRDRTITRSASSIQMRDLKDHMRDLKGRLSNLREQARVDSLKRRSLRSLRTPSPFMHAQVDRWLAEPPGNSSSVLLADPGLIAQIKWTGEGSGVNGHVPVNPNRISDMFAVDQEKSVYNSSQSRKVLRPPTKRRSLSSSLTMGLAQSRANGSDGAERMTENSDDDDERRSEGFQETLGLGYDSESEASLYHDTLQQPILHEDREDAFDYEHFYLHSAMGTMSQHLMTRRGSQTSSSSNNSVLTTRGPVMKKTLENHQTRSRSRVRRSSDASISTVQTFATAHEDRVSQVESDVEFALEQEAVTESTDADKMNEVPTSKGSAYDSLESLRFLWRNSSEPDTWRARSTSHPGSLSSFPNHGFGRENDTSIIAAIPEEQDEYLDAETLSHTNDARFSAAWRQMSRTAPSMHRPSVSSMESRGTTRSFPLVNKPSKANSTGSLTPNSSPDPELKIISDSLMYEMADVYEKHLQRVDEQAEAEDSCGFVATGTKQALKALPRDDQLLLERLVAGLGRCVLGLTKEGRSSAESRMYRRRIDLARRILEGHKTLA